MSLVRILHQREYRPDLQRFSSGAFEKSSSDGGVSTYKPDCAILTSGSHCAHISRFYKKVGGEPAFFWEFDEDDLPSGHSIDLDTSNGDPCHYNINGLSENRLEKFFKRADVRLGKVKACVDGNMVEGTELNHLWS